MSEPITLRGITWDHPRGYAPLLASAEAYGRDHPVRITWDKRSLKDFGDADLRELAAAYDLLVIDHPHAGVAAASGALMPFDEFIAADQLAAFAQDSLGPSFASYRFGGHTWALPVDAACQVAVTRPDLLPAEALPHTWEEVSALAKQLRANGQFVGMALCPTDAMCSFLTLCAQNGARFADDASALASPARIEHSLRQLRTLAGVCHPDCLSCNPIAVFEAMSKGAPIAYAPLLFGYTNYARPGYRPHRLRFAAIPGASRALLGGAGLAVSSHCQHPSVAAAYAAFVCGSEFQKSGYVTAGGQPASLAAWENPQADEIAGGFFTQTRTTIQQASVRPRAAYWPQFQEWLGECIHRFLTEAESPETTAAVILKAHHACALERHR
ncbi:extracellular solute-binding protein [Ruficoccus amylovorans]|uniref:Extracellular solute-binding protein n=1 Tax=Ruficoccus amylovorans TaxID=1804625 RepID=A0A842HAI8_9BACT|nr:extracellular solute-binding protein [Ruficoccus amylovorans]MBC2593503.1 extracellular solute-binding protein [Ruficoccus amylovorans]